MGTVIDFPNKKKEIPLDDAINLLANLINNLPGKTFLIYHGEDIDQSRCLMSNKCSIVDALGLLRIGEISVEKGL